MMTYNNPGWVNNNPPALNAENLNKLGYAVQQAGTEINTIKTQLASQFNYKGVVADLTALEAISNPDQNDTYYVTSEMCLYSWNGSTWSQSSLNESEYLSLISGISDKLDEVTETTVNLWQWGDITCEGPVVINNITIPAGTYTLSASIERAAERKCRMQFWKGTLSDKQAEPYILSGTERGSVTFTIAEDVHYIRVLSGLSDSETDLTVWRNIQLESGNSMTPYIAPNSSIDADYRTYGVKKEPSVNLWQYGDITFTKRFNTNENTLKLSIPAGDYTISAEVVSQLAGGLEAPNATARVYFMANNGTRDVADTTITRNCRSASHFTLSEPVDTITFLASNTSANSENAVSTWRNIQIESGKFSSPFVPPYIGIETLGSYYAKKQVIDTVFEVQNETISGTTWTYRIVRNHIDTRNLIIDCDAVYIGIDENNEYNRPRVRMYYSTGDQGTIWYYIGTKGPRGTKQWRLPPWPNYTNEYENRLYIEIYVPVNQTLTINSLVVRYDDSITREDRPMRIDTHGSFMYYPEHSILSAVAAEKCGANKYITIPKLSSDGVWFAYHDDTFDVATTILRNMDGTRIASSIYNGLPISQIPFTYLEQFDWGIYKSNAFAGLKPMKISELFRLCGKTGMKPFLSLHPYTTAEEMESLRSLAKQYGVLNKLSLKPGWEFFKWVVCDVFRNDVDEYCLLTSLGGDPDEEIDTFIDAYQYAITNYGLDTSKVRCVIELWQSQVTQERVQYILNSGYYVSVVAATHTSAEGISGYYYISSGDYEYLQSLGVTEFCDTHNPSLGLRW